MIHQLKILLPIRGSCPLRQQVAKWSKRLHFVSLRMTYQKKEPHRLGRVPKRFLSGSAEN